MNRNEIITIIILLIIAIFRFVYFSPEKPDYENFISKNVKFEGVIVDDPDIRLNSKHLYIKIKNTDNQILVFTERGNDVSYGDMVLVSGLLKEPENFITNSGKEFNYNRYLANQGIYFIIKNAKVDVISHGHGNKIKTILFGFKNSFIKNINRVIGNPESDLANGLILGVKGSFDDELKQNFIETGTIHIVALSGYNVSIVAENIMRIFGLIFSQTVSVVFGGLSIILFIVMTGASSTAVRAGIMAMIMLLGRLSGRSYLALRALIIAALLMIAYNPLVISDMSFQLSFLATFGVLTLTPNIIGWFRFITMRFGLREMFAATISASIAVLPLILYLTGVLSIFSLPANILILPIIPIIMLFVFITGICGFIFLPFSIVFGYISNILLSYVLSVIKFFATLQFSSLNIISFPIWLTILIYIFIIWFVFKKK